MTSSFQKTAPFALRHGMWQDGTVTFTKTSYLPCVCAHVCIFRVCVCALWLNNDWKKKIHCEDLGTKGDALQDLSNGMAMRALEKSKTVTFHEFLQNKQ